MKPVEKLLKDLISIPSISGNEKNLGEFIIKYLNDCGFSTTKYPVSEDRFNVVATCGEPKVYLSAHMDTVSPMIDYSENDTHIFGRGSCDTKASIASMLMAASNAKEEDVSNFGLIFTVGEEVDFAGVKSLMTSDLHIPFIVVGEPTSLEIVNGHYGILIIKVTSHGKAAHSSKPEMGINAIDLLIEEIAKIKSIPIFPETLMSVVIINGGVADNIIPDNASTIFSFRISPHDATNYFEKMKSIVSAETEVTLVQEAPSVFCDIPRELSFIKTIKTVKYMTELSFYKNGVVLGPGDIKYAHGPDERLPKDELSKAVEIYNQILKNYQK